MKVARFGQIIILACTMWAVTGCQTTTSNSTLGDKNPARAVQLRTQLAAEYIRTVI